MRFRSFIPLALPGADVRSEPRLRSVAPEPIVQEGVADRGSEGEREGEGATEGVGASASEGARASRASYAALGMSVVLFLGVAAGIVWAPKRAAAPAVVVVAGSAPSTAPAVGSAVITGAAAVVDTREVARAERSEVVNALEIGDLRRAGEVARRAVVHDPSEADGWLLLVAAEIELGHQEAANLALRACAERATHGPRGECVALMQPNGPEPRR